MKKNNSKNKNSQNNQKEDYAEKLDALREFFLDVVERNLIARCHYVQLFWDPLNKCFVRLVDEFNPPPLSPKAVQFPLVARGLDFKCIHNFMFDNRDKLNPNVIFSDEPFEMAYDELLRMGLFDEYRDYRAKVYADVFDAWSQAHHSEIEAMDLGKK